MEYVIRSFRQFFVSKLGIVSFHGMQRGSGSRDPGVLVFHD
jgi:hypothetical protein